MQTTTHNSNLKKEILNYLGPKYVNYVLPAVLAYKREHPTLSEQKLCELLFARNVENDIAHFSA